MNLFKKCTPLLAVILLCSILLSSCAGSKKDSSSSSISSSDNSTQQSASEEVRIQDDLYNYVNAEWLKNSVIPEGAASDDALTSLGTQNEKVLMQDFNKILESGELPEGSLGEFLKLYRLYLDFDSREELGFDPIKDILNDIENMETIESLNEKFSTYSLWDMPMPYNFIVTADPEDSNMNALYSRTPSIFLMSKDFYSDESTYDMYAGIFMDMCSEMLRLAGKNDEESSKIIKSAMEFDKVIAEYALSTEERANYASANQAVSFDEFASYSTKVDFKALVNEISGTVPDKILVDNSKYYSAFDKIFNEENFENIKSWMYIKTISKYSGDLTDEIDIVTSTFYNALSGVTSTTSKEERAFNNARYYFSAIVGRYYGETYFGEEAKADVTQITEDIINSYSEILSENDWMSEEARDKAIEKLETIDIRIGYPEADEIDPEYETYIVDESKSIVENCNAISSIMFKNNFGDLGKPYEKKYWILPGDTVNANYSPTYNSINFYAGFLQAPFYDIDSSLSQKYGSIGTVIGHEISHAFDPNGSQFNAQGNKENWWTEDDYIEFEKRTQQIFEQFNGQKFAGGITNGAITNAEDVADNAGMQSSLAALKKHDNFSTEEFFKSWAAIWRSNTTPEYAAMLLSMDVHSPNELRVNIPATNFDEFHEVFDVKDGDKMFRAPDQRTTIW